MKAVMIRRYGGPEVVALEDVAPPTPGRDEVVVKVHAASVNPIDWQIRDGAVKYVIRPPFPATLGVDLAGEVVAVGSACRRLKVGDAVFGMMPHDWGAQAELVALPEDGLVLRPPNTTAVEAAGLGVSAITSVHALRDVAKVQPGSRVLVNGASGGVGLSAIQIAKVLGADVTAVCGAASAELVRGLGADRVLDYRATDFTRGEEKYDVVFDCVGNAPYHQCTKVLRGSWTHVTLLPKDLWSLVRPLVNRFTRGQAHMLFAKATPERLEFVRGLIADGRLKPVIDRVLPVASVVEAQAYSQSGRAKGKIVLTFA